MLQPVRTPLRVPPDRKRQREIRRVARCPLGAKLGTFSACAPTPPSSRSLYHIASPALWSIWALPDQEPSTSTFWRRPRPLLFFILTSLDHKTFTNHSLFDNDASQGSLKATHPLHRRFPSLSLSVFLDPGVNIRSPPLPPRTFEAFLPASSPFEIHEHLCLLFSLDQIPRHSSQFPSLSAPTSH